MLKNFNFEPSLKLQWFLAQDLFGSQISVTTGVFETTLYLHCKGLNCEPLAYNVVT